MRPMGDETLRTSVIAYICEMTSCDAGSVTDEARLGADLGIDGDDAVDLFEGLSRKFSVDLSSLNLSEHFGPDAGANPWTMLRSALQKNETQKNQITVRQLIEAAQKGRW